MSSLERWSLAEFAAEGRTYPTYRRGRGPVVVLIHELPGITPEVITFADEVVEAGFTVVMRRLFGTPGGAFNLANMASSVPRVCVNREFNKLRTNTTSPIAVWLRDLARSLHAELGGPGVGALGMCFTGGFALAMMVDPAVAAPVVAQPSLPFAVGAQRKRDLGLSPADLAVVTERAAQGCQVLGIQYDQDQATGDRFDRLDEVLGANFLRVEIPGRKHATLTAHRQQIAVDAVLAFFTDKLH